MESDDRYTNRDIGKAVDTLLTQMLKMFSKSIKDNIQTVLLVTKNGMGSRFRTSKNN
jgi:hypothetical protein